MSNELTVNSLGDAVRDRVKKAIFDSIPDSAVENLIKNELKNMTEKCYAYRDSGGNNSSYLNKIIGDEIKKQLTERAQKSISEYLDLTYSNESKEMVDEAIKQLAPLFMAGMIENFVSQAVQGLRNQLSSKGIYL